jgi:hypothetical protein
VWRVQRSPASSAAVKTQRGCAAKKKIVID